MKNRNINSNREKHHIYYQNEDCVHRVKKSILHPPFSESQPEKAKKETFFVGSTRILFWQKIILFGKSGRKTEKKRVSYLEKKSKKPTFFSEKKKCLKLFRRKFCKSGWGENNFFEKIFSIKIKNRKKVCKHPRCTPV